jgi:hypothetical protein
VKRLATAGRPHQTAPAKTMLTKAKIAVCAAAPIRSPAEFAAFRAITSDESAIASAPPARAFDASSIASRLRSVSCSARARDCQLKISNVAAAIRKAGAKISRLTRICLFARNARSLAMMLLPLSRSALAWSAVRPSRLASSNSSRARFAGLARKARITDTAALSTSEASVSAIPGSITDQPSTSMHRDDSPSSSRPDRLCPMNLDGFAVAFWSTVAATLVATAVLALIKPVRRWAIGKVDARRAAVVERNELARLRAQAVIDRELQAAKEAEARANAPKEVALLLRKPTRAFLDLIQGAEVALRGGLAKEVIRGNTDATRAFKKTLSMADEVIGRREMNTVALTLSEMSYATYRPLGGSLDVDLEVALEELIEVLQAVLEDRQQRSTAGYENVVAHCEREREERRRKRAERLRPMTVWTTEPAPKPDPSQGGGGHVGT